MAVVVRYGQPAAAEGEALGDGDGAGDGEAPGIGLADGVLEVAGEAVGDALDAIFEAVAAGAADADTSLDPGDGAVLGAGLHPTIVNATATIATAREPPSRCAIVRTPGGAGDHAPAAGPCDAEQWAGVTAGGSVGSTPMRARHRWHPAGIPWRTGWRRSPSMHLTHGIASARRSLPARLIALLPLVLLVLAACGPGRPGSGY